MNKNLLLLVIIFVSTNVILAQTIRKPINISNDFYTIKIDEGVGQKFDLKGGVIGQTYTITKQREGFIRMEDAPLKMVLQNVFPDKTFIIKSLALPDKVISIELAYPGITKEEASNLFLQQLTKYFSWKINEQQGSQEKWTFQLLDSLKLAKQAHEPKDIPEGYGVLEMNSSDGDWSVEKSTLDDLANRLGKKIDIKIDNTITFEKKYHFDFMLKESFDYEVIKNKLQEYGIGVIIEKNSSKVIEIE
jgi:hypothetical protein